MSHCNESNWRGKQVARRFPKWRSTICTLLLPFFKGAVSKKSKLLFDQPSRTDHKMLHVLWAHRKLSAYMHRSVLTCFFFEFSYVFLEQRGPHKRSCFIRKNASAPSVASRLIVFGAPFARRNTPKAFAPRSW